MCLLVHDTRRIGKTSKKRMRKYISTTGEASHQGVVVGYRNWWRRSGGASLPQGARRLCIPSRGRQGGKVIDGFQVRFLEATEGKGNGKARCMRHGGGIDTSKGEGKGNEHGKGKPMYKWKSEGWYGFQEGGQECGKAKLIFVQWPKS